GATHATAPRTQGDHSDLSPASRMTSPHFAHSERRRAAKASGELRIEKMKLGASTVSRNAGSSKMRRVSALSAAMISGGVPLGAARPYHEPASYPGSPLSARVGTSGYCAS